jgi:hypothetical protein
MDRFPDRLTVTCSCCRGVLFRVLGPSLPPHPLEWAWEATKAHALHGCPDCGQRGVDISLEWIGEWIKREEVSE